MNQQFKLNKALRDLEALENASFVDSLLWSTNNPEVPEDQTDFRELLSDPAIRLEMQRQDQVRKLETYEDDSPIVDNDTYIIKGTEKYKRFFKVIREELDRELREHRACYVGKLKQKPQTKSGIKLVPEKASLKIDLPVDHSANLRFGPYFRAKQLRKISPKLTPREDQIAACADIMAGFESYERVQDIKPCGAGKTLEAKLVREAHAKLSTNHLSVHLTPSLSLLSQALGVFKDQKDPGSEFEYYCICSREDVDSECDSDFDSLVSEFENKVSTDPDRVEAFLNTEGQRIIFCTYHSLPVLAESLRLAGKTIDLTICDEAHNTAGVKGNLFTLVHDREAYPSKNVLFMTATQKIYDNNFTGELELVCDMSNLAIFGPVVSQMTWEDAIHKYGILCDYRILPKVISSSELAKLLKAEFPTIPEIEVNQSGKNIVVRNAMEETSASKALIFHSSLSKARQFQEQDRICFPEDWAGFVNGKMRTDLRRDIFDTFADNPREIKSKLNNVRVVREGLDIPAIDMVVFCDLPDSSIVIVQAAGRAMRKSEIVDKKLGYILLPIILPDDVSLEAFYGATGGFKQVMTVLMALSQHDDRIKRAFNSYLSSANYNSSQSVTDLPIDFSEIEKYFSKDLSTFRRLLKQVVVNNIASVFFDSSEQLAEQIKRISPERPKSPKVFFSNMVRPLTGMSYERTKSLLIREGKLSESATPEELLNVFYGALLQKPKFADYDSAMNAVCTLMGKQLSVIKFRLFMSQEVKQQLGLSGKDLYRLARQAGVAEGPVEENHIKVIAIVKKLLDARLDK